MLSQLPESRARRTRRPGSVLISIAVHSLVVAVLIGVTARTRIAPTPTVIAPLHFTAVETPPPPPPPPTPSTATSTATASAAAPASPAVATLIPPIEVPMGLPDIDFSRPVTRAEDFATGRRTGGAVGGVPGGTGTGPATAAYFDWQVERPVVMAPGSRGPAYPEMLRAAGVEGTVLAQFVVDTTGRVVMSTFTTLSSPHAFLTATVKRALETMRFLPAEAGNRKVPQLVHQPFVFSLARE